MPLALSLVTKTSFEPADVVRKALVVGKLSEMVSPII